MLRWTYPELDIFGWEVKTDFSGFQAQCKDAQFTHFKSKNVLLHILCVYYKIYTAPLPLVRLWCKIFCHQHVITQKLLTFLWLNTFWRTLKSDFQGVFICNVHQSSMYLSWDEAHSEVISIRTAWIYNITKVKKWSNTLLPIFFHLAHLWNDNL